MVDAAFIAKAKRLWDQNYLVKTIAVEMGCGMFLITKLRREFGWKNRIQKDRAKAVETREFSIDLPSEWYGIIDRHIYGKYRNKAEYIRALIRKDLNLTQGT